jgi:hypothetical protein
MPKVPAPSLATNVAIALNAVIAVVDGDQPKVLTVRNAGRALALPYGPFDPQRHRTFEIGMREWVERQTNVSLGYVEQLYTFGDKGREAPAAALAGGEKDRVVSVGYLALAPHAADLPAKDALWSDWYSLFPWEDWRRGEPPLLRKRIIPELDAWVALGRNAEAKRARKARLNLAFGLDGFSWEEERTLDRYELMYEAALVTEAQRDQENDRHQVNNAEKPAGDVMGYAMISDHRRILATAIGRLRGKLKYRPVIFEVMDKTFTLLQLQRTVEAIVGFKFHKQNFRRSVEKSGFVENTGETTGDAGGRPAALFRVDRRGLKDRAAAGLAIPRLRRTEEPA